MNLILIQVVNGMFRLSVTLERNNAPQDAPEVDFKHPFDGTVLEEIRWYLEDFLKFPYGINQQKAKRVARKMKVWGSEFFQNTFNSSDNASKLYEEAVKSGLDKCEINISSDDPDVLKLPWEMLRDPKKGQLSLSLSGIYRSPTDSIIRESLGPTSINQINTLMVTARPFGDSDIAYGMVARPVLDAVEHLGGKVHVKLLRPPTLAQLFTELGNKKGFYHVVHFDGHGCVGEDQPGKSEGLLAFETFNGKMDLVSADDLGHYLEEYGVPLFVLNACKSGEHGDDPYSSVASQLIKSGASAVVAMAYTVYATAAREFMKSFYGELVAGKSVSEAVRRGREAIHTDSLRPSTKGNLKLEDWMVPVLYQRERCAPFALQESFISGGGMARVLPEAEGSSPKLLGFPPKGRYGFVGRDSYMLRLERCYREHNIVVLQGMGGMGKTELACGLARWLLETNGRSQAFFISFEHGARLMNVVNQVGRFHIGDEFCQYSNERRLGLVREYLRQNECLLVFDNFESISRRKFDAGGLLTEAERIELSEFLTSIVEGKSWVLITSREEEGWLRCQRSGLRLEGLLKSDATAFAKEVFAKANVDAENLASEYLDLLEMLYGHPLSLQVVLPRLNAENPKEVIIALENGLKKVDVNSDERNKSLSASLKYSFDKLSPHVKQYLPFLCLLRGRVDAKILGCFSEGKFTAEDGAVYQEVFNGTLGGDEWVEVLGEAASSGIVEEMGQALFRLHPTLPWFLRQQLKNILAKKEKREAEAGDDYERLETYLIRFYNVVTNDLKEKLATKDADSAMTTLTFEEPNLLRQLRRAEHFDDWDSALSILKAFNEFYTRRNRDSEYVALRNRALQSVGYSVEAAKSKGSDAHKFWVFLKGGEVNDLLECGKLEEAENICSELLKESTNFNKQNWVAATHYNSGRIAERKRQWEKAKAFYEKSLKIWEEIGDTQGAATSHNQLGEVARQYGELVEAEKHYQDALKIKEDGGDNYESALASHNLGIVKQDLGKLEDAEQLFFKALGIYASVGDSRLAARDCYHLGAVTGRQGRLAEAKEFYNKALKMHEDESLQGEAAATLHGLGQIAKDEGQLGEAIALWWRSWGNFMDGNSEDARSYPGLDLANLLLEVGEHRFMELWRENIEEECQASFMENIKSIEVEVIDEWLHQQSEGAMKRASDYLREIGEAEFKKWFAEKFKAECPQWYLENLISVTKENESLPAAESSHGSDRG